ncbi:MAG: DUF6428 family protein [Bacteroidota bacterium]
MNLSAIKQHLHTLDTLKFQLPDGSWVPLHFHVTEIGSLAKNFIDCGGTQRQENHINFQLWHSGDYDHRLGSKKLLGIIELAEQTLGLERDWEVEIEYQGETISKYGVAAHPEGFSLINQFTNCLAQDQCIPPLVKPKIQLSQLSSLPEGGACSPGSGCC